jgi:surface antigen
MLNRTSLLAAVAVVALSAGSASADQYHDNGQMQSDNDQTRAYANGYSNGYDDGVAHHDRNDRYRTDRYLSQAALDRRYDRGDYYYGNDCSSSVAAGTVAGAIAGGVIGNQFGHGDGRTAATFGGVILGGLAGNAIADDMSCNDRRYAFASWSNGFEGRIGQHYRWRSSERGNYGSFTPVREFSRGGYVCRDFHAVTWRSGRAHERSGTACRQADGNWYLQ